MLYLHLRWINGNQTWHGANLLLGASTLKVTSIVKNEVGEVPLKNIVKYPISELLWLTDFLLKTYELHDFTLVTLQIDKVMSPLLQDLCPLCPLNY